VRALVYQGPMQLELVELPDPVPEEGEAVVAVQAVGLCGSDVHGLTGKTGRRKPSTVMGHEASGIVAALGVGVSGFEVGDRVVISSIEHCGACTNCKQGRTNICLNRRVLGVDLPGAFAELVKVPWSMLRRLPDRVSYEDGALVEPLAVAMYAVNRTPSKLMDTVAIVGAGTIGLLAMLCAKLAGAGMVAITDKKAHRLEKARELGADLVINVDEQDPLEAIQEISNGEGADVVIEAVGYTTTVQQAISLVRTGGHVTWVGNSTPVVELNMQDVVTREVTICGSYAFVDEFDRAIAAIESSQVRVDTLVEARVSLEEAPELAVDLANGTRDLVKAIILP
jgi:L-iditol 2-dehydrogenase